MAQPEYVPVNDRDRVRVTERLPPPGRWIADRPAEVRPGGIQPAGPQLGVAGPDQGYALKLAHQFAAKVIVPEGESREDAVAGCLGVATRRASLYGRAPVMPDVELAFTLWGWTEGAPADLVSYRKGLFAGAAHHYNDRRKIVDLVPEASLRMTPPAVRERLGDWRTLLSVE
jgi:hypothetical protein